MAYLTSSKKIRDNRRKDTIEDIKEYVKEHQEEILAPLKKYVDEALSEERERREKEEQAIKQLICDMVLEVSLDSVESLDICTKQQRSRLFEIHAIYTLNGGANGFVPRLEALPEMNKSLQEALDSR